VFSAPSWYINVESKVGEPTSLTMLELVTRLWMPSPTHEPIERLSKVLDGTLVTRGSGIGRGPNVVFRVSFSIGIMSLVLSFKSWKLNNGVLTNIYATSCIWSWHSISLSMENCVFSLCACILGTREFDAVVACGLLVSSPFTNKVHFSSVLRGWKNCGMTPQSLLALVIGLKPNASPLIWITYLVAETLGATLASCVVK
jgi:hypothetical protein